MTLDEALSLARDLIYGPLPKAGDPTPAVPEALAAVQAARRNTPHTWLTGEAAEEVLRQAAGTAAPAEWQI